MDTLNNVTVDVRRPEGTAQTSRPAAELAQGGSAFASVLDSVQGSQDSPKSAATIHDDAPPPAPYTVRQGDSLSAIAQNLARQRGVGVSAAESYRLALDLAARNQIPNPDRILPGQQLQLQGLYSALEDSQRWRTSSEAGSGTALSSPNSTQNWLARRSAFVAPQSPAATPPGAGTSTTAPRPVAGGEHPVLQQTLERAVAKGFIPPEEKQAVQGKILQLAQKYQFSPDDFARMTLMESDGMNPRATNQRCHGIIQFCDGPNRGAAAVGYGQQPRAILGLSVYQQLHLVDNYFQDNGLGKQGPAKLDDLYLTVLQPAARKQQHANVPLNIPGQQARDLHVGANTQQAITRQSIVDGLLRNTRDKLQQMFGQSLGGKPEPLQIAQGPNTRQSTLR